MRVPARNPEPFQQSRPTLEPSPSTRGPSEHEIADSIARNFSIVLGGPVYDFLKRFGIVRFALPNVLRRIAAVVAVTWLPLLLASLKDGLAFGHRVSIPFLLDVSMYGRFLLALPLLLLGEIIIDPAIRLAVAEFLDAGLIPDQELPKFESILQRMLRVRDAWIPEVILLALAFFPVFLFQHEWTAGAVSSWHTTAQGLTGAGWWFAVFSGPFLRFIIYRWAFRYFIWSALLWRIGRMHLILMPTHPDHAAGLNFLGLAQKHFGVLLCALGCAFAGRVANSLLFEGSPLSSFKYLMMGFIALSVIVGVLPLLLLTPTLMDVRKAGILEYGRLANYYTKSFDRKWVHYIERPSEPLLGTGDIQSLADIGNSFAFVDAMRIVPITRRLILQLAFQAALPLIPVIVVGTPLPQLVEAITKMVV